MALRNIMTVGEDILRKKAKDVVDFGKRTHVLLDDMWETMAEADGVGLAAPQVGILRKAVVIDVTPPPDENGDETAEEGVIYRYELLNPVILESRGECLDREGCLSVPGVAGDVLRPESLRVRALDRDGNSFEFDAEGLLARAVCHEVDHLEGVLFTDIAETIDDGTQKEGE